MIGILELKDGVVQVPASIYQPSEEIKKLTLKIKQDYSVGFGILHRKFEEFNDMSLIERSNADQKAFNSYVEQPSDNPDHKWRWNGVRPITANKVRAMAAHLMAATLVPGIFAQNDLDEEDKDMANVMRYLVEHVIRNSNYEISYRQAILGALVNPIAYLHADYAEVLQTIKERMVNGEISEKEVVDEVLSGFQAHSVPGDEILIANPYQYYLQRQRFLIRRKFPDYDELQGRYGNHPNWKFIRPGIKALFNEGDSTFYDQFDPALQTLGEEVIYYNRRKDIEVPFINGIYLGDINIKNNSIKHRDNKNRPKYPYAKTGFGLIDEGRFFYYKSLVFHLADDQELDDRVTRLLVDASWLEAMPPTAGIGTGNIDSQVMFPGSFHAFPKEASITSLGTGRNLGNLYSLLNKVEQSIDESSVSKTIQGQVYPTAKTKWEVQRAETNSIVQQGMFGRMLGDLVKDFGELTVDLILQHETVGQATETLGGETKLKFRTILLPNQTEEGKKITRKIVFKPELIGKKFTGTEKEIKRAELTESFRIKKEEGDDKKIYEISPRIFRNLKFSFYVDYETLLSKDQNYKEQIAIRDYQIMRQDPMFDQKQVARELAENLKKGESDKFISKQEIPTEQIIGATLKRPMPQEEMAGIMPEE